MSKKVMREPAFRVYLVKNRRRTKKDWQTARNPVKYLRGSKIRQHYPATFISKFPARLSGNDVAEKRCWFFKTHCNKIHKL